MLKTKGEILCCAKFCIYGFIWQIPIAIFDIDFWSIQSRNGKQYHIEHLLLAYKLFSYKWYKLSPAIYVQIIFIMLLNILMCWAVIYARWGALHAGNYWQLKLIKMDVAPVSIVSFLPFIRDLRSKQEPRPLCTKRRIPALSYLNMVTWLS